MKSIIFTVLFFISASLQAGQSNLRTLEMDPTRLVELIGVVDISVVPDVSNKIHKMTKENHEKPLYIFINSPGGSVMAGMTVVDAINAAKSRGTKVICATGFLAASMGYVILAHCDERYVLKNTKLLFHPMSVSGASGRVGELATALVNMTKEEKAISEEVRHKMGMKAREYYKNYFAETMWSAFLLAKRTRNFITIVDDIQGTENLFVYRKPNPFSFLFGNNEQEKEDIDPQAAKVLKRVEKSE